MQIINHELVFAMCNHSKFSTFLTNSIYIAFLYSQHFVVFAVQSKENTFMKSL
jgi:hypothetical protein